MKLRSLVTNFYVRTKSLFDIKNVDKPLIHFFLFLFLIVMIRRAWVSDDAYITFRTVDNFVNGYGLTWNTGERVQAYTNTLWMFLISFFYFFTHEVFFTVIIISLLISFLSICLIPIKLSKSKFGSLLAILALLFSNAFVDYTTSGLENPLSFLLSAIFLLKYFSNKGGNYTSRDEFVLSAISSLAALNRLDSFVVYLPALIFIFWKSRQKKKTIKYLVLGQLPIILWEMFSIIYYGFPFPNTYYAKLNHMMPKDQILIQGGYYCLQSLLFDPITLISVLSCFLSFVIAKKNRKDIQSIAVLAGVMFYIAGIVSSGGDFMAGRFFALPVYITSILLSRREIDFGKWGLNFGLLVIPVLLGSIATPVTFDVNYVSDFFFKGIANERSHYFSDNALINQKVGAMHPDHEWAKEGMFYETLSRMEKGGIVIKKETVGMAGFFAGPKVHIIDEFGLGDPLLARLPAILDKDWRIGHFLRSVPQGYEMSVRTGENLIKDEGLSVYFANLSLITRGKIFDTDRFKAIIKMNLGYYDQFINIRKYQLPN